MTAIGHYLNIVSNFSVPAVETRCADPTQWRKVGAFAIPATRWAAGYWLCTFSINFVLLSNFMISGNPKEMQRVPEANQWELLFRGWGSTDMWKMPPGVKLDPKFESQVRKWTNIYACVFAGDPLEMLCLPRADRERVHAAGRWSANLPQGLWGHWLI